MPKVQKVFNLEVTPEKFLNACDGAELVELIMLLNSTKYQERLKKHQEFCDKLERV